MKDYIEIDGKRLRVNICWNAIAMFFKQKGVDDMSEFGNIVNMSAEDVLILMYWAIYYGEQCEQRELPYTSSAQLGNIVGPAQVAKFIAIFGEQMKSQIPKDQLEEPTEEVKKKGFFSRK